MLASLLLLPLFAISALATACKKPLDSAEVRKIFAQMASNSTAFFHEHVVPNVDWTVTNPDPLYATMPLSGRFHSLADFQKVTFDVVNGVMKEPIRLIVIHDPVVSGNQAVIEMQAKGPSGGPPVSKYGYGFDQRYCWYVKFNDQRKITTVRAYVDSAMVNDLVAKKGAQKLPKKKN